MPHAGDREVAGVARLTGMSNIYRPEVGLPVRGRAVDDCRDGSPRSTSRDTLLESDAENFGIRGASHAAQP